MLADLLSRVITFSLERQWIEYIGFLMDYHLPAFDHGNWVGRLMHVLYVTLMLVAVIEIFNTIGARQRDAERARMEHELVVLKNMKDSF